MYWLFGTRSRLDTSRNPFASTSLIKSSSSSRICSTARFGSRALHGAAPLEILDDDQLPVRQQAIADVFQHRLRIVEVMIHIQDQHALERVGRQFRIAIRPQHELHVVQVAELRLGLGFLQKIGLDILTDRRGPCRPRRGSDTAA